jgi:hypothetical protein
MMKNEEIIEMARQAGLEIVVGESLDGKVKTVRMPPINLLETFAKLVAEKEREACAKLLETTDLGGLKDNLAMQSWVADMLLAYVKAIRARGQA